MWVGAFRFCNNTSSDADAAIMLWHYQESDHSVPDLFGEEPAAGASNAEKSSSMVESWCLVRILRGHLQDVTSLDFSPCGSFLVSVGGRGMIA